jgi:FkbM family methyltransferase
MVLLSIVRMGFKKGDIVSLLFLLFSPVLYILDIKRVKLEFGVVHVPDRIAFRAFVYGFFKTFFIYGKNIRKIMNSTNFSVIVDVGACEGDFSLSMADIADKIIAIEPVKRNFRALKKNAKPNMILVNCALGEKEEIVSITGHGSNAYLVENVKYNDKELVTVMTFDRLAQKLGISNVDIIKIDTQGHEMKVLKGMHQMLLNKAIKLVIVEVHIKRGVKQVEIIKFMKNYGYKLIEYDKYLFDQPHLYFCPTF